MYPFFSRINCCCSKNIVVSLIITTLVDKYFFSDTCLKILIYSWCSVSYMWLPLCNFSLLINILSGISASCLFKKHAHVGNTVLTMNITSSLFLPFCPQTFQKNISFWIYPSSTYLSNIFKSCFLIFWCLILCDFFQYNLIIYHFFNTAWSLFLLCIFHMEKI